MNHLRIGALGCRAIVRRHVTLSGVVALSLAASAGSAHAQSSFAYVTNYSDNTVSAYRLKANGEPVPLTASPYSTPTPLGAAATPSGRFLYVANYGTDDCGAAGTVSAYKINPNSGALTPLTGSPYSTGGLRPYGVTVSPSGRFVYAANYCSNDVSAFAVDPDNGQLTAIMGSPFAAGSGPLNVSIDQSGRFAYVNNVFDNTISVYAIGQTDGSLTPISGSPFAAQGLYPGQVLFGKSGLYAYIGNSISGTVAGFAVDQSSGSLTPLASSPYAAGGTDAATLTLGLSWTGEFVYAMECSANIVATFGVALRTGDLSAVATSSSPTDCPRPIAVDPDHVYIASVFGNSLSVFNVNNRTGVLTATSGTPFPTGAYPGTIVLVK